MTPFSTIDDEYEHTSLCYLSMLLSKGGRYDRRSRLGQQCGAGTSDHGFDQMSQRSTQPSISARKISGIESPHVSTMHNYEHLNH